MKRLSFITMGLLVTAFTLFGCASQPQSEAGWITLFDGTNLNNWTRLGDANWRLVDGVVQADLRGGKTASYLVSKNSYTDFQIRAEFWVDSDANSGIFIRVSDPENITGSNSYEVNIFDKSTGAYGTGGIPNVAVAMVPLKAGGQWNTYDITARGPQITVILNGTRTIDVRDTKFSKGPIALQYGTGVVKFRKLEIRPL